MKIVEMFFARLPDPAKTDNTLKARHRIGSEDIVRRAGQVLEGAFELREIPETPEKMA